MKRRIAKKLKAKGQWDLVRDAPMSTSVSPRSVKPSFLGETSIVERYVMLQSLDAKHPLLQAGTMANGHFQFDLSREYNDPLHGQINYSKSSVLVYVGALMRAIRDLGGEAYQGEREFNVRLERIAQGGSQ